MILIDAIRAFSGRSSLPVYEFSENDVNQRYYRISPRTAQQNARPKNLSVSAWRLAHAVRKADCARWPSSRILSVMAAGFLYENIYLFDWNPANLRFGSRAADFYVDFSKTGITGRIGQGMALLFLEDQGYSYIGRFSTLVDQHLNSSMPPNGGKVKMGKSPDFVVENKRMEQALAEAKGRFIPPGGSLGVKSKLKEALRQLENEHRYYFPRLHKNFAVGTFLRGSGDKELSFTAYVETAPGKAQTLVDLPQDAILRANYASWLSLMGFDGAAGRLRARAGEPERHPVSLFTLGKDEYVVAIRPFRPSYLPHTHVPDLQHLIREWWRWIAGLRTDGISVELIGLNREVVRRLEAALREPESQISVWKPESETLADIDARERRETFDEFEFGGGIFSGSVFSDGSLIGELKIKGRDMKHPAIEPDSIEL